MPKPLPVLDTSAPARCATLASGPLGEDDALAIALRLKALADPVRVRLMSIILAESEQGACTCDLAPAVGVTEATASHHLKQLRDAGLVEGTRRGTNVHYRPRLESLGALCRLLDPTCC
ncbi:MAG: metalloregulator ArsR/SmtB family transcription factor [Actinomycetota bacterium]|nr:metalloregulator ArsR/SmtB family transcription factor [Actinomycetota bacterium]